MYNFKNPFEKHNANSLTSEQISDFFAEPFDFFKIRKESITNDTSSIIFIGARGTGKTMLLKQFSYNVQKILNNGETSFLSKVQRDKFLGVYFRVDNALLRSLDSFSIEGTDNFAEIIFSHFYELTIFKDYLEITKLFFEDAGIDENDARYNLAVYELKKLIPNYKEIDHFKTINDLLYFTIDEINYIWDFKSKQLIDIERKLKFSPACGMVLFGRLTNEFCKCKFLEQLGLKGVTILSLIDEFESFSESQQKIFNTAMRYTKDYGARLRIGMRPQGFKTYATQTKEDFIKEGRDYKKVEFDNPLVHKENNDLYPELIKKIAKKRLSLIPMFADKSIVDFLGEKDNLEEEAKKITNGETKHFDVYINEINKVRKNSALVNSNLTINDLLVIRDDNPLYEMECLLLLLRGEELKFVVKALNDYKSKKKDSVEYKKFSNDYDKKYKLSFIFILCSIYKKEKKDFYGFMNYCQLSSGIIGHFIKLCERAFELAYFRGREALAAGEISNKIQTDAAYEVAYTEKDDVQKIAGYGSDLYNFLENIGSAFSHIHRDIHIRYPETNQFPISQLKEHNIRLLNMACTWSIVIKKANAQDVKGKKQDIYILNRIFAPIYKISYRTRGGLNPILVTDDYFESGFNPTSVLAEKQSKRIGNSNKVVNEHQITLFDLFEHDTNEENNN